MHIHTYLCLFISLLEYMVKRPIGCRNSCLFMYKTNINKSWATLSAKRQSVCVLHTNYNYFEQIWFSNSPIKYTFLFNLWIQTKVNMKIMKTLNIASIRTFNHIRIYILFNILILIGLVKNITQWVNYRIGHTILEKKSNVFL